MILKPNDWLFVSTMKCATNSLYEALSKLPETLWLGGNAHHSIPQLNNGVKLRMAPVHFTCCRNPYDRAVSIWASTCLREESHEKYEPYDYILEMGGVPEDFDYFVLLVLANEDRPEFRIPWLYRNQSDWQDEFIVDRVLHTESLEKELDEVMGIQIKLKHENTSPHNPWEEYYLDKGTVEAVQAWAGDDFRRFGYDP